MFLNILCFIILLLLRQIKTNIVVFQNFEINLQPFAQAHLANLNATKFRFCPFFVYYFTDEKKTKTVIVVF